MVYHVGSPAMFEGNRFLPETGTPIWKMLRNKTVLELCDPEPLTVATWILMSLITRFCSGGRLSAWRDTSVVAIPRPSSSFERKFSARKYSGAELFIIRQRNWTEQPS